MNLTDIPARSPNIVSRIIDEEAVVVHLQQGRVRVLNPVGARLWELANGRRSVAELAGAIVAEYNVDEERARADVLAFINDLVTQGLLVVR